MSGDRSHRLHHYLLQHPSMLGISGKPLVWFIYDEFTTPDSAPITSPRTCEPGPGTLTIVDTGNNADIVGGKFSATGYVTSGNPGFNSDLSSEITDRIPGLASVASILVSANTDRFTIGLHYATSTYPQHWSMTRFTDSSFRCWDTPIAFALIDPDITVGVGSRYVSIIRSNGVFHIIDGKLVWVGNTAVSASLNVPDFFVFSSQVSATDTSVWNTGVLSLPANGYPKWGADFSEVTDELSTPSNGDIFDCPADGHISISHTFESTKYVNCYFRQKVSGSTSDCLRIYIYGTSATSIRVYKLVGGIQTLLGTASPGAVDGTLRNVDVVAEGTSVKVFENGILYHDLTITDNATNENGGEISSTLVTNDIELVAHPHPALGIATNHIIAPQDDEVTTMTPDAIIALRNVAIPINTDKISIRYTDDNNTEALEQPADGGIDYRTIVGGAGTVKIATAPGTVSDGDVVVTVLDGSNAEIFVNGVSAGTTAAAGNATATGVVFTDLAGGWLMDSAEFWTRDVSALLPPAML